MSLIPRRSLRALIPVALPAFLLLSPHGRAGQSAAPSNPVFTVAWSTYAGSEPYPYLESSGLLKKWSERYHVEIKLKHLDYAAVDDAYGAKTVEACVVTNLDSLRVAASSHIDTTVLYVGDSSNGSDMILGREKVAIQDLSNKKVLLDTKSVSSYLLERGIEVRGSKAQIPQLKLVNAAGTSLAKTFLSDHSIDVAATWRPITAQIMAGAKVNNLFDSSRIPGEIFHVLAMRTDVLKRSDGSGERFAKALTGAWYDAMYLILARAGQGDVLTAMASASGETLDALTEQLTTVHLILRPRSSLEFANSGGTKEKMKLMTLFCFNHKLLGDAQSPDDVAVEFPDKTIQGKPDHVLLRLESLYVLLASGRRL